MTKRRRLTAGLLLLAANSSWLLAFPAPTLLHVCSVLAHIGVGVALVALPAVSRSALREFWSQSGRVSLAAGRPKAGQGRACTMKAKAFSFTRRTKVFADGTVRKSDA